MATEWYYELMGEPQGPVPTSEMKRLTEERIILPNTRVRRGTQMGWVRAEEGWQVVSTATAAFPGFLGGNREEIIVILEHED